MYTCTFITASKLSDIPFQRENSPLAAPVISRLPSGAHCGEGRRVGEGEGGEREGEREREGEGEREREGGDQSTSTVSSIRHQCSQ